MLGNIRDADVSTPAVVLKFDPNVLHHGGLGVIRSLGRLGVPVYGVHEGRWAPAANSRYLRGRMLWQPLSGPGAADQDRPDHAERIRRGLLDLADRIGRRAVLLPTDDAGAIFLAEHGAPLREAFLFPAPPADLPRRLAGKYSLGQLCQQLGVPSPRVALATSATAAADFAAAAGFPVVAKLTTPWRQPAGRHGAALRSTTILRSATELDAAWRASADAGTGLMLQEYLPGGPGQDWFFHGYCDADAACHYAFTGVKDRSYPAHAGLTSLGRSVRNPVLRDQCTALLARLGYRGLVDLDLRFDPRDGQYKLLDFNPRLGAQFRLFTDRAGVDLARAAYLDLTGQPVIPAEPVTGRRFLVENYDPLGAVSYWRRGELGLTSWAASLRGVDETAWFARDDLLPFGLMCLRMSWRAVSRPFARGPGPAPRAAARPRYRQFDTLRETTT
jgi:D-aspartate ligase